MFVIYVTYLLSLINIKPKNKQAGEGTSSLHFMPNVGLHHIFHQE